MRLPVIFNNNFQIQDLDGTVIADLFRNPKAVEDGKKIVELLNGLYPDAPPANGSEVLKPYLPPDVPLAVAMPKISQRDRMLEYWKKRKAKA